MKVLVHDRRQHCRTVTVNAAAHTIDRIEQRLLPRRFDVIATRDFCATPRNPASDVTPPELITGVITPAGVSRPRDLWPHRMRLGCTRQP